MKSIPKKLTPEIAAEGVCELGLMAFFPSDAEARGALTRLFLQMIETEEQLDWLINHALSRYSRWPGVAEIRALYCSRFRPKDGIEGYSETCEAWPGTAAEKSKADVSADADLDAAVRRMAAQKSMAAKKGR